MVRKSTRNAAKAVSPEKEKEKTKSEPRRPRRSRRSKRSESTSASENSDEEVEVKSTPSRRSRSTPDKSMFRSRASKRLAEEKLKIAVVKEEEEEDADEKESNNTKDDPKTDGDKQKRKMTTRSSPSPDRSKCMKLESENDKEREEQLEDKSKSPNREDEQKSEETDEKTIPEGSSPTLKEEDSKTDDGNDERGKGKSKGKNNSKLEKSTQQNDSESQSQSEISENVQVTPVSPTRNDIPVDNDEPVSANDDVQNKPQNQSESTGEDQSDQIDKSDKDQSEITDDKHSEESPVKVEEAESAPHDHDDAPESTPHIHDDAPEITNNELIENTDVRASTKNEDTPSKSDHSENDDEEKCDNSKPQRRKSEIESQFESEPIPTPCPEEEEKNDQEVTESDVKSEHLATNDDGAIKEEDDQMKKEDNKKTEEKMEDENSSEQDNHSVSSTEPGEIPKEKLRLKRCLSERIPSDGGSSSFKKWGEMFEDFAHLSNFNLVKVTTGEISEFCSNLELLDESELKLEIIERISLQQKDKKKADRKVSIEHSSSETERPPYESQVSETSVKSDDPNADYEDNANIIAMNRKISIVEDTASKLKPPPSPAKNPVSAVLYITNLVRPFTLKQLKEMLERTGKIKEDGFWTDRIKSKCYVHYETVEEAEATRNAIHGVNWPIGNGKKLVIDYATPEDLEKARNPPPPVQIPPAAAVPETTTVPEKENQEPHAKRVRLNSESDTREKENRRNETHHVREWDLGKEHARRNRSRTRSRSRERNEKRRHRRTPSPRDDFITRKQKKLEETVPQKLMDDLFQKTKAMPSIFWQPLTPEEISTKQQQRLQRMAEHKRRMEESSQRNRADFGRAGPFRRRHD